MQSRKVYYAVQFSASSGAQHHPAFSLAVPSIDGSSFLLSFPVHIQGILKSRQTQKVWAQEKVKHLRSWGTKGEIITMQP